MKLNVSLAQPGYTPVDLSISCDVTTTVEDTAQAILKLERFADEPRLRDHAGGRLTLIASADRTREMLLDPLAPIGRSGVQSGWWIRVARELDGTVPRTHPLLGVIEVLGGEQHGARFGMIAGRNTIGRGRRNRVPLTDPSISRRHAVLVAGKQLLLQDLGSANGIERCGERSGKRQNEIRIDGDTEVRLGAAQLRIRPTRGQAAARAKLPHGRPLVAGAEAPLLQPHETAHTRSPRVEAHIPTGTRELPAPPEHPARNRLPILAMLAPMILGAALYLVTRSPMSLMMVAFSPMLLVGSWLDAWLTARRRTTRDHAAFTRALGAERAALVVLRERETASRMAAHPSTRRIAQALLARSSLLWARGPTHENALALRLGVGELPSSTRAVLPGRGSATSVDWEALLSLEKESSTLPGVPVVVRLGEGGALGVAGTGALAASLARALVLQLVGLHSPRDLVLAAVTLSAAPGSVGEWEWLRWLPHTDSPGDPLRGEQLARDDAAVASLVARLENVVAERVFGQRTPQHRPRGGAAPLDPESVPKIVVLIDDTPGLLTQRSRLLRLAETGPGAGVHVIWLARGVTQLPAACATFVEFPGGRHEPRVGVVRDGVDIPLAQIETLDGATAESLARSLCAVTDAALGEPDESDLPARVQLRDLHRVDFLSGPEPILARWHATGSIMREWRRGEERAPIRLAAVIGQGDSRPVRIDVRADGPHALVGGTTGSGKSEFLQSWIVSLAANVSPDRLTFLLVDYKGGAAFADCARLPHTVGLVTDLTPHLAGRALLSLRAELRRREEVLAECGAKDLVALEQRSDPRVPPALMIVVDEFATLAREVPGFLAGVLDIAQRGRSLGLHLVLATQRPAGVITDSVRANTNLRIALRMADDTESSDVLGVADAARFAAETPGRGAMRVGGGRVEHFQTGYLGESGGAAPALPTIRALGHGTEAMGLVQRPERVPRGHPRRTARRDIEVAVEALIAAAQGARLEAPRRPWLDPLPSFITLDTLLGWCPEHNTDPKPKPDPKLNPDADPGRGSACEESDRGGGVIAGVCDEPEAQKQSLLAVDFDAVGNVAVFGAGGTGKTSALLTLAAAAHSSSEAGLTHIYALDAAGGALAAVAALPTVGAVALARDTELTRRVLRYVHEQVGERGARFAAVGAGTLAEYRAVSGRTAEPRLLVLIDGFAALLQTLEQATGPGENFRHLGEIMQRGRSVGVHVALTSERPAGLPAALAASVQLRLVLRLSSPLDYAHADVPANALEHAPSGRALVGGTNHEVQLAHLGATASLAAHTPALEAVAAQIRTRGGAEPHGVRRAPTRVALGELPVSQAERPVCGIATETLEPATFPPKGLAVFSGPAGSGLSTAALTCVTAHNRWARQAGARISTVLLSLRSEHADSPLQHAAWTHCAFGDEAVAELARELARPAEGGVGSSHTGLAGVIVVERATDARSSTAIGALVELAHLARRSEAFVIFEHETVTGSRAWELGSALRHPTWGLALGADPGESHGVFGEYRGQPAREDLPPGRGLAIERGSAQPVLVALAEPRIPAQSEHP